MNQSLEESAVKKLSDLPPEQVKNTIRPKINFLYRRHQNADGGICYLEHGDLHDGSAECYSIDTILKRIRSWLAGHVKDSLEVELFAHFPRRASDIQFLLPDNFFDTEITKGIFYFGKPLIIHANCFQDAKVRKVYIGVYIEGCNTAGVRVLPKVCLKEEMLMFARIPRLDVILKRDDKFLELIKEKRIIEGFWWDIAVEPEPFSDTEGLAKYIGQNDPKRGYEEIASVLKESLTALEDELIIGFRFPGRHREKDWQFFRLKKGTRSPLVGKDQTELIERLKDYSIEAICHENFTDAYFHLRNSGRSDRRILESKKIVMMGCGALGSEITDSLAKSGIGHISFVDYEIFNAHNSVRHVLGFDSISFPKAEAMQIHIAFRNPFVNTSLSVTNVLNEPIEKYHPENFLGVSTIADDNIEAFINEQAVNTKRIIFYARALRGGKAARIFRVSAGTDACKACLALYSQNNDSRFLKIDEDGDLLPITNECNNPIRPASAADLKAIAALTSRIVIDFLEDRNNDFNHWIWATEPLEGIAFPEDTRGVLKKSFLPPHPDCGTCKKLADRKIKVSSEMMRFMSDESQKSGKIETGGILIGHSLPNGDYEILRATGPGPKSKRTALGFEKDVDFCQEELIKASKELGEKGFYIGEWHYHPKGSNQPSQTDVDSLTAIAAQKNYTIDRPVMIILSSSLEPSVTIHEKNGNFMRCNLEIIHPLFKNQSILKD